MKYWSDEFLKGYEAAIKDLLTLVCQAKGISGEEAYDVLKYDLKDMREKNKQ